MIFFFKKKEIVLDCFCADEYLLRTQPVERSTRFYPEWWRKLDSNIKEGKWPGSTIKRCVGFTDYFTNSFTIPLWSDLAIKIDENRLFEWQFSDKKSKADVHPPEQRGEYLPESSYGHMKLISPWVFKTKEDIKFAWSSPIWNFDMPDSIIIPPAVLSFNIQHQSNVNLFVNLRDQKNLLIPFGQPMAQLLPMTERKVKLVRHLVDEKEIERIANIQSSVSFINKYRSIKNNLERFSDCPYHKEV